jgi:hypothetical protein
VQEVLGPYVAAITGSFGIGAATLLCADLPRPRHGDAPIAWLLASWRRRLEDACAGGHECDFGHHRLGCAHCPFRTDASYRTCWPAPFNTWVAEVEAAGLTGG